MQTTIFYSWQSDSTAKFNRNYIQSCIDKAIKALNKSSDFNVELNLERDTKGEAGSPDIVNTIFRKINDSSVFIADISFINPEANTRKTPNPNVLLELGFAANVMGWANIICIFNEASGQIEELPFDLKFRRILRYKYDNLSDNTSTLAKDLEIALKIIDPIEITKRTEIAHHYSSEPEHISRIALKEPNLWEYKLAGEILKHRFKDVLLKFKDVERGHTFVRSKEMSKREFVLWMIRSFYDIKKMILILNQAIKGDLEKAWGEPGISGNAIEIRNVCIKVVKCCYELIEWKIELNSLQVDEELEEFKKLLLTITDQIITETCNFPQQLLDPIYKSNQTDPIIININISFEIPNAEKIKDLINYYSNNPHLLL